MVQFCGGVPVSKRTVINNRLCGSILTFIKNHISLLNQVVCVMCIILPDVWCCGGFEILNTEQQLNKIMEAQYTKLNKKLDMVVNHKTNQHISNKKSTQNNSKVVNLTNIKFTQEQLQILSYGPNFAIELTPKKFINVLIIDTENAIRNLETKLQEHIAT